MWKSRSEGIKLENLKDILKKKGYIPPKITGSRMQRQIAMFYVIDQWYVKNPQEGLSKLELIIPSPECEEAYEELVEALRGLFTECKTIRADYIPCITPVGHATLSTGHNPRDHQIIGREWYIQQGRTEVDIHNLLDWLVFQEPEGLGFPEYIDGHNLCREVGMSEWFKIVCAAKDFIPFILGGNNADIQMYLSMRKEKVNGDISEKWELHVRCVPGEDLVDAEMRELIRKNLTKFDKAARWVGWDKMYRIHVFALPNFDPWKDVVEVDIFFANILPDLMKLALKSNRENILVCQSFWSTDRIGHRWGPGSKEYWETLSQMVIIIADQINWVKNLNERIMGAITTDHGGRSVSSKLTVEWNDADNEYQYVEYSGEDNIEGQNQAIYQAEENKSRDVCYWYNIEKDEKSGIYRKNCYDCERFAIKKDIMKKSYQEKETRSTRNNRPVVIEIPAATKYFYPSKGGKVVFKGFHGASVSDSNPPEDLNAADYIIPYILFSHGKSPPEKYKSPNAHKDIRESFFSLIKRYGYIRDNKTLKPKERKTNVVGKRRLSLSGLSHQCEILDKFFRRLADYLEGLNESQAKSIIRGLIANIPKEEEGYELSEGIQRLIKDMLTNRKEPPDFKKNLLRIVKFRKSEVSAMKTLKSYFNIDQIRPDIEKLRRNLEESSSKEQAIASLRYAASSLMDTAAKIEELLA